jgi:hypothetical protein
MTEHSLFKCAGDTVIHDPNGKIGCVLMTFDGPEGEGKIVIERGSYGAYIHINGKCLALADLFYFSRACKEIEDDPGLRDFSQMVLYSSREGDDPLGYVHWWEDKAEILVEHDLMEYNEDPSYGFVTVTVEYDRQPEQDT